MRKQKHNSVRCNFEIKRLAYKQKLSRILKLVKAYSYQSIILYDLWIKPFAYFQHPPTDVFAPMHLNEMREGWHGLA
jgi:hypothetical protein